ncbi:MAG: urease accessory protein UreF [Granulosicoccaceae bacterium]
MHDQTSLSRWLQDQLLGQLQRQELPLLAQFYAASAAGDMDKIQYWNNELLAFRETSELRAEEKNRGRAMGQILKSLDVDEAQEHSQVLQQCQHAGFAWACAQWSIPLTDSLQGFAWSWLENAVLAAVKIVPLGQSSGQQVLFALSELVPDVVSKALRVPEQDIGFASPAVSYASSAHETQYTRLYRS